MGPGMLLQRAKFLKAGRALLLAGVMACPLLAGPAEEAESLLRSGDLKQAQVAAWGLGGQAGELARARYLLVKGLPEQALQELKGPSPLARCLEMRALMELRRTTEAVSLLRELEREKHSKFPYPYDYEFYLDRGKLELLMHHYDLAVSNFREAGRRARTPGDRLEPADLLVAVRLLKSDLEGAEKALAESESSMQDGEVWATAGHLKLLGSTLHTLGRGESAVALNRACREIHLARDNPVRATEALLDSRAYLPSGPQSTQALEMTKQAVGEYLQAGAVPEALSTLENSSYLWLNMASAQERQAYEDLLRRLLREAPQGSAKERAELLLLSFQKFVGKSDESLEKAYRRLMQSTEAGVKIRARLALARTYQEVGKFSEALELAQEALADSTQRVRSDRDWKAAPGPILSFMASLERQRHNDQKALELVARALESQPTEDWTYWRVEARYEALMTCIDGGELEAAQRHLREALQDIDSLLLAETRAGAQTMIFASLLVNLSVAPDVLDPAELLFKEYPEKTRKLIESVLREPGRVESILANYDELQKTSARQKKLDQEPQALCYKALFLEAVDRVAEARSSLESALAMARDRKLPQTEMLAQLLLARIALHEGQAALAADYTTGAAAAAQKLNPRAAQFYLTLAGSMQREVGRYAEALKTFDQVASYGFDGDWKGWYGRATTLERLGRLEEAEEALARAEADAAKRGLQLSVARMKVVRARLLTLRGEAQKAATLFRQAHEGLAASGSSESLRETALSYSDFLREAGDQRQAFEVLSQAIEQLSTWNELSYRADHRLLEEAIDLALQLKEGASALRLVELSRSAELVESVELKRLDVSSPETALLLEEIDGLKRRLASLKSRGAGYAQTGGILAETRAQFFSKLNELKAREPDFEALVQVSGAQLSAVQQSLAEDTALVEYFPAKERLYFLVVTAKELTLHELSVSRDELERRLDEWLALVLDPQSDANRVKALGASIRRLLIAPFEGRLQGIQRLKIVPSGALWEVPFTALNDDNGTALSQAFQVSYLTSSELLKLKAPGPETIPRQAVLVEGSDDLPGARQEVEEIKTRFPRATVLKPRGVASIELPIALHEYDLIHIASHSQAALDPAQCYVQLGDARLTLEQIYGLRLGPESLVVLSSCQSGAASGPLGREVTSLATAFHVAGAATTISSRWRVDDQSTAQFFRYFYRALEKGQTRGQALNFAEVEMAKQKAHPYFWAGFSLLGRD